MNPVPKCGQAMPDGRSRIMAVVVDGERMREIVTGPHGLCTICLREVCEHTCRPDPTHEREPGWIEVGFILGGQMRYRSWPCTNRRAKRERCKARRRERLAIVRPPEPWDKWRQWAESDSDGLP